MPPLKCSPQQQCFLEKGDIFMNFQSFISLQDAFVKTWRNMCKIAATICV